MSTARIKQDAEKADQMIRGFSDQQEPGDGAQEPPAEPEEGNEHQEAADDQGAAATGDDQGQTSGDDGAQDTARKDDEPDWEHRYRSLNGMLRQRDQKIEQLYEMIAAMSTAQAQQSQQPQEDPAEQPLVSKDDETAFGSDLIDLVRRVTREEFNVLRKGFMEELQGLKGQVQQVETSVKQTASEKFEAELDKRVPSWRNIDADPKFIEWLQSSPVRNQQFVQAVQKLDHVAAGDLFEMYGQMTGQAQQQKTEAKQSRRQELEKQVAPGKSRKVSTPDHSAEDKKTWTRSEIARFYADKRNMDPKEFARQEKDVFAAQAEGRVDYSR